MLTTLNLGTERREPRGLQQCWSVPVHLSLLESASPQRTWWGRGNGAPPHPWGTPLHPTDIGRPMCGHPS
eukprot:12914754-Alexandrium_andersonii.AAC.1